ncbi:hypothetical protein BCV70DRAFT_36238 [Testicularia cyperi]|uniref:Uncharacterized protein n=1 Tax=Testicularia cyperi TaxID=1882483 RepID=A0A317XKB1_9BASI|nr:hypothetical protein BCV70DRAFT_36238 [Testicularia cyperi]
MQKARRGGPRGAFGLRRQPPKKRSRDAFLPTDRNIVRYCSSIMTEVSPDSQAKLFCTELCSRQATVSTDTHSDAHSIGPRITRSAGAVSSRRPVSSLTVSVQTLLHAVPFLRNPSDSELVLRVLSFHTTALLHSLFPPEHGPTICHTLCLCDAAPRYRSSRP